MKQFKTLTGQDLPKPINWLANKEHERLGAVSEIYKDTDLLFYAFDWAKSNILSDSIWDFWREIDHDNFQPFYDHFPICKNSRGQILPDDIQIEIIEERLRQPDVSKGIYYFGFEWLKSKKGSEYWKNINRNSDYSTQSDEFTQGEIVEVSRDNQAWDKREYVCKYKDLYITFNPMHDVVSTYPFARKFIQPTEYTIDQLIEIVSKAEGKPVKLKV